MAVDWKMSPVHPSSSMHRVLEEIKEIPAESWWNSCLPLSFPLDGPHASLSIEIAIEEGERMDVLLFHARWLDSKEDYLWIDYALFFFYVREVNLTESKVSWFENDIFLTLMFINLWPIKNFSSSMRLVYFAKLLKITRGT